MQFETIADIYAANEKIRENLIETVSELDEEQENLPTENGKWTLGGLVEHTAKAGFGMMQICQKLLSQAEGTTSDGSVKLSQNFIEGVIKDRTEKGKIEAPEMVHPEGGKPITESLAVLEQMTATLKEMRPLFESVEVAENTFPHPAFGNINAHDWLVLIGGHEARHTAQITKILER